MKNLWNQTEADACGGDALSLRVYTSRLLGADSALVMHGGGNTSVKADHQDVFGESIQALYVKGSGWDLRTIEAPGFPPTRLDYLCALGQQQELSDLEMMRQLRLSLLDPGGPTPSVEAILHALIPHRYVDHSHADAVVTISNTPNGEEILRNLYGDEVLVLPYIMPGFVLARQVAAATAGIDWQGLKGIVLLHHGIFTFADDARISYDAMIELVSKAEDHLDQQAGDPVQRQQISIGEEELQRLCRLRRAAGELAGAPVLVQLDSSDEAAGFASLPAAAELIQRGPLTPDHTIHAKSFGAVFDKDPESDLAAFGRQYREYFDSHAGPEHRILDAMPRYGVWPGLGMVYLAMNRKRLQIVADISRHTVRAIQYGEALGAWQALPQSDLFAVEYWELEQAKLNSNSTRLQFEGKVALVSGAASGIGKACVQALSEQGAVVIALDIAPMNDALENHPNLLPLLCDVSDAGQVQQAIHEAVASFGGIDLLVSNAGSFPASAHIEDLDDEAWQASMDINLNSHMKLLRACTPYLKLGFDPAVVVVGSKNVPAPGPAASAYSVAKAGLNQLARVAALELGQHGIRVNTVHPNAVYDTAIWNEEVLASRAGHYGLSVEDYKRANVLQTELQSSDVAATIVALLGSAFSKTTGAQVPVDGGNERVI